MSKPSVGGYVLVDGTGLDESTITSSGTTIAGIYAKFDAAFKTNKPVIVENVINGDNEYGPFDVSMYGGSLAYQVALVTITVKIAADDKVTKLNTQSSN